MRQTFSIQNNSFLCGRTLRKTSQGWLDNAVSEWKWLSANPQYQRFLARPRPWPFLTPPESSQGMTAFQSSWSSALSVP
jgi:hypothetical protein